jgi:hypothetical protein
MLTARGHTKLTVFHSTKNRYNVLAGEYAEMYTLIRKKMCIAGAVVYAKRVFVRICTSLDVNIFGLRWLFKTGQGKQQNFLKQCVPARGLCGSTR